MVNPNLRRPPHISEEHWQARRVLVAERERVERFRPLVQATTPPPRDAEADLDALRAEVCRLQQEQDERMIHIARIVMEEMRRGQG
jgi:hypothetical protein